MISVDSLTRNYGDFTAVDAVSFEITKGEIVGLLGHNGAGKTTIMRMVTGFLEPTSGRITIDGLDIRHDRKAIQSMIGYLPENCPLYSEMHVIDYLDYAASLHNVSDQDRPARVREAIALTRLEPKAADRISTLSRGYRQRVGVAQAMLHQPGFLILDEPTNGLDPTQIQQMRKLIKDLAAESTVILSTHVLQEVQAVCNRVIILNNGHKALDAKLDDLQSGNRLLVATNALPEMAEPLLKGLEDLNGFEILAVDGEKHQYALTVDKDRDMSDFADQVSRSVLARGFKLFALTPEVRDLESIFAEITNPAERVVQ